MTFNPSVLGFISTTGITRSETVFEKNQNFLTVTSDGNPSPARVDITEVQDQSYNFSFVYRAGDNTQYPQEIRSTDDVGIFSNGVVFRNDISSKQLPNFNKNSPVGLNFNKLHFVNQFELDADSGESINGKYFYKSGAFLKNGWDYQSVWGSKAYYADTNFEQDYYRHTDGHSKILGFSFDGYPIYGPFGYATPTDSSSGVKLIKSSYRKKLGDSHRNPNWKYDSVITLNDNSEVALTSGAFLEDYEYVKSKSTLDEFNGQYCVTPDFPEGTYAYFLTFDDEECTQPAYPYIIGNSTRQQRVFDEPLPEEALFRGEGLWSVATGARITTLIERNVVYIPLPLYNIEGITTELISGEIPAGLRFEGNVIVGTVYEVAFNKTFTGVIRATYGDTFEDRTIEIAVSGPDAPEWITAKGLLPVGNNNTFYILDSEIIDFQLEAIDSDLSAGDELRYYIADGDGELPPGITLDENGRIYGTTEPLLSLDKRYAGGRYDMAPFSVLPLDFAAVGGYYGTRDSDTVTSQSNLIKLNRYYPFAVTVSDGQRFVKREFRIFVVGDDFLKADNTEMEAGTTLFNADATHVRNPTWITPRDLGFKRANNYVTIPIDIINNPTLEGAITYTLENLNDDGSTSELPPGLSLDKNTGELYGIIPYQSAIVQDYKFTIRATRRVSDLETLTIFGTYYEDTLLGKNSFKIYKTDLTGTLDGINDLFELVGEEILVEDNLYTVTSVDDRDANYDLIVLDQTLAPKISLLATRTATAGQDHFFVSRLTEKDKSTYQGRTLKFSENESYKISSITPFIEYNIRQNNPSNDDIYPADVPVIMTEYTNYFVGDFAIWPITSGGNGRIFKCIEAHSMQPITDENNEIVLNEEGQVQIRFEQTKWVEVAETLEQLSIADRINAAAQSLEEKYGAAYVRRITRGVWNIRIPSNSQSRIIENIRSFFESSDSTEFEIELVRDNEDRILLDTNLSRQIAGGNNVGIALFQNQFFYKNIIKSSEDPVNIPSSVKTFEVKILGEVDTDITWVTDKDLGTIPANFPSTLKVVAQSTVPDTKMVYTLESGKLPNGLILSYSGEIIGAARQFGDTDNPGLTIFESKAVTWDGKLPGDTTFDRNYKFTVKARDRFNFKTITKEFSLLVEDLDDTQYTDVVARPMLPNMQRSLYKDFISNTDVFVPSYIYRPNDERFGVQKNIEMLMYAGIEATEIDKFVAAAAKNHKRKKYILGDFKTAKAIDPATREIVYEVVYIDVIDPAMPKTSEARESFRINTESKITVDSIQYAGKDDVTKYGLGTDELPVYGRQIVKFVFVENDTLVIETRSGDAVDVNVDNNDFDLTIRDGNEFNVILTTSPAEPYRLRPKTNTIKADSDAIKVSNAKDDVRYISNIANMRNRISDIGKKERNFLPLWMRSAQAGFQELDFVSAIPVCYCLPGRSDEILRNIVANGFDTKQINFDIDRYIVKRTKDSNEEKYVVFANYQFNV